MFHAAFVALALLASQPDAKVSTPLADHPVARMVGTWRGTVTAMGRDGQWHMGVAVERARWNLAGTAIIVEGYGYSEDPATGERTVRHDALGVIEHDAAAGAPRFYARRAGAPFESHTLQADPDTGVMTWSPKSPQGVTIRFTLTITDRRWHEVGEMSPDGGQTWNRFLESDMARADPE